MLTPVSASPASRAAWIGDAPRQRGSSEACTFTQPRRGRASTGGRQQQPVGHDHEQVRRQFVERSLGVARLEGRGLEDGNAETDRQLLHGAGGDGAAAARRPVRLGEDRHGPVAEIRQSLQGGRREGRRSGKDDAPVQMTGTRSREGPSRTASVPSRRRAFVARFFRRWRFSSDR